MADRFLIRARAPVRADFAGGWTDVPVYASDVGGVVTNAALELYVHVECVTGGGSIRLHAEDLGEHATLSHPVQLVYDGKLDLHKAALNMLPVTGGVELLTRAEIPAGSGLGGSGALDVALVAALAAARGEQYDDAAIAELAFQLEATELGLEGGRQDQCAAALGGWHELAFSDAGIERASPIDVSHEQAADLARSLVLVYTGETHFSSQTHRRVWDAYAAGSAEVVDALAIIRDLGAEAATALRGADWERLARVIDDNWRQQQRLDATIATPGVRAVEQALRAAGVWGVKATGAGAGGCLIGVCPPTCVPIAREAAVRAGAQALDVGFDFAGVQVTVQVLDESTRS